MGEFLYKNELEFAFKLANISSEIALKFFNQGVKSEYKDDGSPVTLADITVEKVLIENIISEFPDDGILGEESQSRIGKSLRKWIIDPVDGTSNFIEGKPEWGTHIALEVNGKIVIGVITRPILNKRWWSVRGNGSFCTDLNFPDQHRSLSVSSINILKESKVSLWSHPVNEKIDCNMIRIKTDLNDILRIIEGEIEAVIDLEGKPWDHAPVVLLVEEAGGHFEDNSGGHSIYSGGGWYTNGLITQELKDILTGD